MPPKAEITKEKILYAAFEIVRQDGLDDLSARSVAQKLRCSTQPIYSVYGSMEALKDDVYDKAVDFALASMKQYEDNSNALAMNMALGGLLFAKGEKQLFRTIYLSDYRKQFLARHDDRLSTEIYNAGLQIDRPLSTIAESRFRNITLKLTAYWLGICTLINTDIMELDIEQATEMLEEMFQLLKEKEGFK